MPVVPQYQPLQPQTGNVTGGLLSARVPQGAFGGATAEGLAALGRSAAGAAGVAGQVMIQQAEEVNRIKVRQALTEARTETSASVTALMSKTGLNATNVQAEGMERMKTLRSTILEKLDNARQREMFGLIFDDDVAQQVERLGAHQAAQIKAATIQTREAENVSFKNAAVSEHMNPAAVEKNRSFIHSNILETLTSMGASEAIKKAAIRDADTQLYSEIVQAKQRINPIEALAFLKSVKKSMSAEEASKLEAVLDRAIPEWEGEKAADRVFEGLGQNPHRKYAQAREMLGKEKFSDDRSKMFAEARLLQRHRMADASKREQDEANLNGLLVRSGAMTHSQVVAETLALDLEPDILERKMASLDSKRSIMLEKNGDKWYYDLRSLAFDNPEEFLREPLSAWGDTLKPAQLDNLRQLRMQIEANRLDDVNSVVKETMKVWEVVNPMKGTPTDPPSAEEAIEHERKRRETHERVLGEARKAESQGTLNNPNVRFSIMSSSMYDVQRKEIPSTQWTVEHLPGESPYKLTGPVTRDEVKNDASVKAMMAGLGLNVSNWRYEISSGLFSTDNKDESRRAILSASAVLPSGYTVSDISGVSIDLRGMPVRLMFKNGMTLENKALLKQRLPIRSRMLGRLSDFIDLGQSK